MFYWPKFCAKRWEGYAQVEGELFKGLKKRNLIGPKHECEKANPPRRVITKLVPVVFGGCEFRPLYLGRSFSNFYTSVCEQKEKPVILNNHRDV